VTTIDQLVAMSKRLAGAPVLFVGHGRSCGPGPGVLLVLPAGKDKWELPTDEVTTDSNLDAVVPFGDVLLARVDSQFEPAPSTQYDDHCWTSAEFAVGCAANHPSTTAVLQQFLAAQGDSQLGDLKMDSSRKAFFDAQAAAEPTYRAFNDSAPPPMQGEPLPDYEARLVRPYQKFCKQFSAAADLAKIGCQITRRAVAAQIYKDALQEAAHPTALSLRPGETRQLIIKDAAGREMKKTVASDDGACWNALAPPYRYVRRFNVPGRV
jgi:hypothetical protein